VFLLSLWSWGHNHFRRKIGQSGSLPGFRHKNYKCLVIEKKTLIVINLGQTKSDDINRMITLNCSFYKIILSSTCRHKKRPKNKSQYNEFVNKTSLIINKSIGTMKRTIFNRIYTKSKIKGPHIMRSAL
jgi:hypothetical protein